MKQYFKIGEISKLYQIGVDSLRYYEELGLLTPKRGKNGYRLYRLDDIWRLNVIRDLRGLGFSMERIREYLTNRSIDTTELLLNEELNAIHRKMAQLRQLQSNVEQRLATLQTAKEQPLETVTEIRLPARSCHVLYSGYQKDEEMDILMKQLLNQSQDNLYIIGSNHIGSLIPVYAAKSGQFRKYEGVFVIAEDGLDILPKDFTSPTATAEITITTQLQFPGSFLTLRRKATGSGRKSWSFSGWTSTSLPIRKNISRNFRSMYQFPKDV